MPKITRKEAFEQSVRRWEAFVKGEVPAAGCGFCEYIKTHHTLRFILTFGILSSLCCKYCPLYPDICGRGNSLYSQWLDCLIKAGTQAGAQARSLASHILEAVKERGKVWIYEEVK